MDAFASPCPTAPPRGRRRRLFTGASGLLAGALAIVGLAPLAQPASGASLYAASVSPVDNATGYPFWFGDRNGLRLELCLDDVQDPLCGLDARPNPTEPLSMPENFPDESFWWAADALIQTPAGVRARLVLAQEAAFGGPGEVAVDQQVAFSRLRIRIDDLTPGGTYHVTTPYGERDVVADDRGRVFETDDQGCLSTPCDFTAGLNGQIGPFLTWDSGAPEGYVGDPAVEHTVTGSPTGNNLFRVEGPDIGGPGVDSVETNLFSVQGRIARPRATVSDPGDLYAVGTPIEIISSFPGESTIFYTTDGSDPTTSPTRATYTGPVELPLGATTLKYAVQKGDQLSPVYTEEYTTRADLSVVTATPAPAVAPAVLEGRQEVTLTANTMTVDETGTVVPVPTEGDIYFTTDGTRPRLDANGDTMGSTRLYEGAITITRNTTVKAISVPSAAGVEPGPVGKFRYVIHNLRTVSAEKSFGYPAALEDIGLPAADPTQPRTDPVSLELCLDDPLCPVVGELPDPTRGLSFPDNFPDESFWWSGEAEFTAGNVQARLVLAAEAAFDSPTVQDDHQVAFGRIRVRLRDAVPGATYEIVHPYGVVRTSADDRGRLFYTDDNGCMSGPCGDFKALLTQPVGPFLRWDTGAPDGYVGDPGIPHAVVGSPYGTNVFTVHQVTDGQGFDIDPVLLGSTDLFNVQGKLAGGPGVMASWQTGTFDHELDVVLTGTATTAIHFTTDGSEPTTSSPVYNGPIHIDEGVTTLSYIGVGPGGTSLPETEVYTVQLPAPDPGGTGDGGGTGTGGGTTTPTTPTTPPTGGGTTTPPPPTGTAVVTNGLTLQQASAGPVDAGRTTTLQGVLASNGQAVAGAPVVLQARALSTTGRLADQGWVDVDSTTTATDGSYAFRVDPTATTQYRVVLKGDSAAPTVVSSVTTVKVRAVVKLSRPDRRVERGDKVTLRGSFGPTMKGAKVVVKLDGPGHSTDKVRATVNRHGTWKVTLRAPHRTGKWSAKAVWHGDASLLRDVSASRTFRVTR